MHDRKLSVAPRRRARKLAIWNGAVWAIGNGLASTTLVIYLAKELHAERLGLGISLIVAAPQIAGLLRLGAPALIGRLGDRKRFCIATFLAGASCCWCCRGCVRPADCHRPAGRSWRWFSSGASIICSSTWA